MDWVDASGVTYAQGEVPLALSYIHPQKHGVQPRLRAGSGPSTFG
jgi:hypothetical protein